MLASINQLSPNQHWPIRRVAVLSVHTCPLALLGGKKTGGMNVYVRDFCRELARQGVQVDIFTRSQDDCQPMIKHDLGHGGRVIHIPAGPECPLPVPEIEKYLNVFTKGVLDLAKRENLHYDLIYSHYWLSGLVAEKLRSAWQSVPILHMFHTLGHMKNQIAQNERERAPLSRLKGEKRVVQTADRLIAATPAEVTQLVEFYGADENKIDIVSPGVDLERFSSISEDRAKTAIGMPTDYKNILFAGRIEPLKGIDTLLEAINIARAQQPHVMSKTCVTIIGGDPAADELDEEMARLQTICSSLGLHDLVTFAGAKDQTALPYYYAASEMIVMPSTYESFGLVALEAMAMGKPVIASEVGGLAHLVQHGETGFHVPVRDAQALASRILDLLLDKSTQQRLGQQAHV